MSHALAVANETVKPLFQPDEYHEVRITVEGSVIATDPPYIRIGVGKTAQITWTLDVDNSDVGVQFDTPAISFFGENANMVWLAPSKDVRTALWVNDDPGGRSYSYRLHLLRMSRVNGVDTFSPVTDDPIIHNEPPPAP